MYSLHTSSHVIFVISIVVIVSVFISSCAWIWIYVCICAFIWIIICIATIMMWGVGCLLSTELDVSLFSRGWHRWHQSNGSIWFMQHYQILHLHSSPSPRSHFCVNNTNATKRKSLTSANVMWRRHICTPFYAFLTDATVFVAARQSIFSRRLHISHWTLKCICCQISNG